MPIVSLNDIYLTFGPEKIFDGMNLKIFPGEKIGLVGPNGSGKTTLLRLIFGQARADSGSVFVRKGIRLAYLPQEPRLDPSLTVRQALMQGVHDLHNLRREMEDVAARISRLSGAEQQQAMKEYEHLHRRMEIEGAYDYAHQIEAALDGLGLPRRLLDENVTALSGGQMSRLFLAKVLISRADLLLLDEPTNHLDLQTISWLENYLRNFVKSLLVISHDRYLLDAVVGRIVEIDRRDCVSWTGNYSDFVENREKIALHREREYEKRKVMVEKTLDFIARNKDQEGMRKTARGRKTRLERLLKQNPDFLARDTARKTVDFQFGKLSGRSELVLRCEGLKKAFGELVLFEGLSFDVLRGQRLCITGPNGTGKSTLLRLAMNEMEPTAGRIRLGTQLKVGYLDQRGETLNPANTILDEAKTVRPDLTEESLRGMLGAFLFSGEDVYKRIAVLSGGQRNRLMLFKLMAANPDVLILDEPTNHLDIPSCEALERALDAYEGTIIAVSHDRYFLDCVAEQLLILGESPTGEKQMGRFEFFKSEDGAYTGYTQALKERNEAARARASAGAKTGANKSAAQAAPPEFRPFNKYKIDEIEEMILNLEDEIETLQEEFGDEKIYQNPELLAELNRRFDGKKARLELLYRVYDYRT